MSAIGFEQERRAASEGALLSQRGELGALIITGKDRQSWLNGLVTCDLAAPKVGQGVYGLAVGKTGKILAELWIVIADDHLALALPAARIELIREHFDRHVIMEDVEIEADATRSWIVAAGPKARELVGAARSLGADAAMVDFTGRGDTAAILPPIGALEATRDALLAGLGGAGALAGDEAWEALRVAWGVPRFGVDFDEQNLPQEPSLERIAVSFAKGCYLGQEAVFMLEKRGHAKKRLMRLAVEGTDDVARGAEITLPDGTVVGDVTSRAESPEGGFAALGYVKWKHAQAGAELLIAGRKARAIGLAAEPFR